MNYHKTVLLGFLRPIARVPETFEFRVTQICGRSITPMYRALFIFMDICIIEIFVEWKLWTIFSFLFVAAMG